MKHYDQPIKLSNFTLYSGDVITANDSIPLLVEIVDSKQKIIRLRKLDLNEHLCKSRVFTKLLSFTSKPNKALVFFINENDKGISLKTDKGEYLNPKKDGFCLSAKGRILIVSKQENSKSIADFSETAKVIDRGKEIKEDEGEEQIAYHLYDNKSNTSPQIDFTFSETRQEEHSLSSSSNLAWEITSKFKAGSFSCLGIEAAASYKESFSTSNSLTKTKTKVFSDSIKIECEPWKKTIVEFTAKKVKLVTPYKVVIKRNIGKETYEYLVEFIHRHRRYSEDKCSHRVLHTKDILLVGWTGSGKSTLAKVLSNDDNFKSGDGSTSVTKFGLKSKDFEYQGNYYSVIDNIGFGDVNISEKEVLMRIGKAINLAYQGLSHVLFVFDGRFSEREKESLKKLLALKITNDHVTLIRSKFDNYENKKVCDDDQKDMENESKETKVFINNCRGLLYIDNEDKESQKGSRVKVLNHLNMHNEEPYKPKEWENIVDLIERYFMERRKLDQEKKQANESHDTQKEAEIEQVLNHLESNTAEQVKGEIESNEQMRRFIEFDWS